MATLEIIGSQLQNFRKRQGLTLSELAQRSHIHRNTLSALERGVGNVELNTLLALCEQLGLELVLAPRQTASFGRPADTHPVSMSALRPHVADQAAMSFYDLQNDNKAVPSTSMSKIQKRIIGRLTGAAKPQGGDSRKTGQEPGPTALQKRLSARLKPGSGKGPK